LNQRYRAGEHRWISGSALLEGMIPNTKPNAGLPRLRA